jgi:hypothetical protein
MWDGMGRAFAQFPILQRLDSLGGLAFCKTEGEWNWLEEQEAKALRKGSILNCRRQADYRTG